MFDRRNEIAALRLSLASPYQIRSWSSGEVTRAETINYLTQKPEPGGLFCERIFGPTKDWCCSCGKYRRARTPGIKCEKCGVEVTTSSVRRERMGHLELVVPVAHPWFAKASPSTLALLLDLSVRQVKAVLSYSAFIVTSLDESVRHSLLRETLMQRWGHETPEDAALFDLFRDLSVGSLLDEHQAHSLSQQYGIAVRAESGAEALRTLLTQLDLADLSDQLRAVIQKGDARQKHAVKRLHVVEAFRASGANPAWMILDVIPVLPPELRPLVPLSGGQYIASDLNSFYERILHRNARIKMFLARGAPDSLLRYEKRLLQDACDALFDNARRTHPVMGANKQPMKSLTDALKGKQGRFRRNLLGKRVDYSGRSVIVGDVSLKLHQCGLPTKMCLELFKPFLIRRLVERNFAPNAHVAKRMVERTHKRDPIIWDVLEDVLRGKVVLLNRAPTLHRLSIQAFEVKWMSDSNAIRLHPCVCSSFNADFDGDQMAVHLPLSDAAQAEAKALLLSTRNLRSPASGEPAVGVSQEMVLGLFYLTQERPSTKHSGYTFASVDEALLAVEAGVIDVHTRCVVRIPDGQVYDAPGQGKPTPTRKRIETTAGRLILNSVLPEALRFKNYELTKERCKLLIAECMQVCSDAETASLVDALKSLGFKYATKSGISFALSDCVVPKEKPMILAEADAQVEEIEEHVRDGMITAEERYQHILRIWTSATEAISALVEALLDPWGSLTTIIRSGATKAKFQQIRQLSGMRGLMASPSGRIIEIPIRTNYVEGMTARDAFTAGSAARNGFMGRSLNTAVTGYLTRKLVETGMEVWITMRECGTSDSFVLTRRAYHAMGLLALQRDLVGRVLAEPVGELSAGTLLTAQDVARIVSFNPCVIRVRSVLMCQAPYGVCQECYGGDLATGKRVRLGSAVGILAGQSIGEPGTQLSMRAFHSGGIANAQGDIRSGLPRVIEIFEGGTPSHPAPLTPCAGTIHLVQDASTGRTTLSLEPSDEKEHAATVWSVTLRKGQTALVQNGEKVEIGVQVASGACDPRAVLETRGPVAVARYLIEEVQSVFQATGVFISNKHLECIVRQMLRYVRVSDPGDTNLLPGDITDRFLYQKRNAHILAQGGTPARGHVVLLGLTRAVLQTSSWVAAASFQETSRVITKAALWGQRDNLYGYKERIIVGRRIPSALSLGDIA